MPVRETQACLLVVRAVACLVVGCGDEGGSPSPRDANVEAEAGRSDSGLERDAAADAEAPAIDASVQADAASSPDAAATKPDSSLANADASIDDVDLTLGGFNQDLPAPSTNCVAAQGLVIGCLSVTGTYNGQSFSLLCDDESDVTVGMGGSHVVGCRGPAGGGDLVVELRLDPALVADPPHTFDAVAPTLRTYASVWQLQRGFASYPDGVYELAATHDQVFRLAGISESVRRGTSNPPQYDWRLRGSFALSLSPQSSCVEGGETKCDVVKLRATYLAHPIE